MDFGYHLKATTYYIRIYGPGDTGAETLDEVDDIDNLAEIGIIVTGEQMYIPSIGEELEVSRETSLGPNNLDAKIRDDVADPDTEPGEGDLEPFGRYRVLDKAVTIMAVDNPDGDAPAGGSGVILLVE